MKKIILSSIVLGVLATALYAGVEWIDYSTGDYKCLNGYQI